MVEALSLIQRVRNSISLGESHFREFKTALEGKPGAKRPRNAASICREIGEALVAFANADGGELFIGVEDDGDITGLNHSLEDIETMKNAITTHILDSTGLLIQHNNKVTIDGKEILFFSVAKSTDKIFQLPDGRCMRRQDKSTMPASIESIEFARRELQSREYDRIFVDGASVNDLDLTLVQQVADKLLKGMSPEQYLQQVNLAEYGMGGIRLRRAALLLFAKDIIKWFPYSQIRILKVDGDEILTGEKYNAVSDSTITGNIFSLLINAWEQLRPFLSQKTVFAADAKFEQTFSYPENACREALVNAIAHRDYSISTPITIYIYSNKLVFESPGELLSTVSLNDLLAGTGAHESRNVYIARVLRENNYMRELGEGIRRIFELMQSQELAAPTIESKLNRFYMSMTSNSVYSERELMWLEMFKGIDLDLYQKRVIIAGIDGRPLSPNIIYSALGSFDRNLYDSTVTTLRVRNILAETLTSTQASLKAKKEHIAKQDVCRFIVVVPKESPTVTSDISKKIYIYNLPENITIEIIEKEMSIFGLIEKVQLPVDEKTKKPRSFAFVTYKDKTSALRAIATKDIKILDAIVLIIPYKPYNKKHNKKRSP